MSGGPGGAGADATLAILKEINDSGRRLLGSCTRLASSLPVAPLQNKAEWPELLGHFKNVGQQLAEVSSKTERHLEHAVPVPTAPAASQDGSPTMIVPELLRTKKPPEQEATEEEIRESIVGFLPDNDREEAREEEASLRLAQFNNANFKYNRDLEDLVGRLRDSDQRASLKRKCNETVTRFSARKRADRSQIATDMVAALFVGQGKTRLVEMPLIMPSRPLTSSSSSSSLSSYKRAMLELKRDEEEGEKKAKSSSERYGEEAEDYDEEEEQERKAVGQEAAAVATPPSPCSGGSLYGRSPDVPEAGRTRRLGSDATDPMCPAAAAAAVAEAEAEAEEAEAETAAAAAAASPRAHLIAAIGDALEEVAGLNDVFCQDVDVEDDALLAFRGSERPSFRFRDYLARLVHYLGAWKQEKATPHMGGKRSSADEVEGAEALGEVGSPGSDVGLRSLLIALIYTDRIHQVYPRARISTFNMHRIILAGMLLAVKFTEDRKVSNRFWAQVGGLELAELNHLEFQLCALLKFDLFIHPDEYETCSSMVSQLLDAR
ncbi:Cyclin-U4-1 [Hondaea fermentalgiana]|uniref:Cyclin-U4-1 n=1 Tax=Hondaea fermentalgiana TaxID=2315210 RepID=A0A2R5G757_9STRA|nr:Cyclin-U4-1 [Hondaea fermentalgiana]|eukprot:GBG26887.1 Cyclin-U4-1 [Hondaea fermentalgiana]